MLDSLADIQQLDKSHVYDSVQALADQIADAWVQVKDLDIQIEPARVRNVVIAGMGGSGLGPDVIKQVFRQELRVPFEIFNDYGLPGYVDEHSLVLLASYSGTTEETLAAAQAAARSGAQVLYICTGGDLAQLAAQHNWSGYQINPQHNPSNQPRMAIGYAVFGAIALFIRAGLLQVSEDEVFAVIKTVRDTAAGLSVDVPMENNQAKQMAFQMQGRIPVLLAAEHLVGAIHVFQNQINENAKNYAEFRVVPEINHHLMEGLQYPSENERNLFFVLFDSPLYHARTQIRMQVTQDVIARAHIDAALIGLDAPTRLQQAFEVITFGAYTNFYLAMLNGLDPAPIPTVDYFKDQLKKQSEA